MSNIKLKDHNWAAEGIYDTNQSKSQQTINSDVSTKIGQATLQTSSQNLSGATNELKGRADTLDSKYDNVVTVANTQPSSEYNKVWLSLTVSEGTQVPTWAEHQALESSLNGAISQLDSDDIANASQVVGGAKVTNALETLKGSLNTVCLRAAVKTISANGTSSNTLTGLTADHVVGNWGMFSDSACTTPIPENAPPCDITITTAANAWSVTIANYSSTFYLRPTFILKQN